MSTEQGAGPGERQPSEEELRAAYEAEIKRVRIEHIILEQVVSLINLGMRRTGLTPGTEDERDLDQVRLAIDAVRALLPVIAGSGGPQVAPIRDALSQLQLAFVKLGGTPSAGAGPQAGAGQSGPPGGPEQGAGPHPPGPGGPQAPPPAGPDAPGGPGAAPAAPDAPGPAQRSGRLWIPGQ